MFVEPDAEALIASLAAMLNSRILPESEGTALYYGQAALSMIARHQLAVGAHRDALQQTAGHIGQGSDVIAALESEHRLASRIEGDVAEAVARLSAHGSTFLPVPSAEDLTRYVQANGRPDATVREVHLLVGGNSKQTIMFDLVNGKGAVEPLVMRRDHPNCYADTCVVDEYPIIRALFDHGFPVPEPVWIEAGSPIVPGKFLISRKAAGEGIGDYFTLTAEAGLDPVRTLAGIMVRLHAIDVDRLGNPALASKGFTGRVLAERIAYWRKRYAEQADTPLLSLQIAFDWLDANRGVGLERPVIVHGDPGCHNILVAGQEVTSLLDWEFGHVGSVAEDLSYCRGNIERMAPFKQFVDEYRAAGGHVPSSAAMEYYNVYRLARSLTLFAAATHYFNMGDNDDLAVMQAISILTSTHIEMLTEALLAIAADGRLPGVARRPALSGADHAA